MKKLLALLLIIISQLMVSCSKHHEKHFQIESLCTSKSHICSFYVQADDQTYLDELFVTQKIGSSLLNINSSKLKWYGEVDGKFVNNDTLIYNNLPKCKSYLCSQFSNPTAYDYPDDENALSISAVGTVNVANHDYYINLTKNILIHDLNTPEISAKCSDLKCVFEVSSNEKSKITYSWYNQENTIIGTSISDKKSGEFSYTFKNKSPKSIYCISKDKNGNISKRSNIINIFTTITAPKVSYTNSSLDYTFKVDTEATGGKAPYTYTWYDKTGELGKGKQLLHHYTKNAKAETVWAIATDKGGINSDKSNIMTFDVNKNISAPTISAEKCSGLTCTIDITKDATGGIAPYSYNFFDKNDNPLNATKLTNNKFSIVFANTVTNPNQNIHTIATDKDGDKSPESNIVSVKLDLSALFSGFAYNFWEKANLGFNFTKGSSKLETSYSYNISHGMCKSYYTFDKNGNHIAHNNPNINGSGMTYLEDNGTWYNSVNFLGCDPGTEITLEQKYNNKVIGHASAKLS